LAEGYARKFDVISFGGTILKVILDSNCSIRDFCNLLHVQSTENIV